MEPDHASLIAARRLIREAAVEIQYARQKGAIDSQDADFAIGRTGDLLAHLGGDPRE